MTEPRQMKPNFCYLGVHGVKHDEIEPTRVRVGCAELEPPCEPVVERQVPRYVWVRDGTARICGDELPGEATWWGMTGSGWTLHPLGEPIPPPRTREEEAADIVRELADLHPFSNRDFQRAAVALRSRARAWVEAAKEDE